MRLLSWIEDFVHQHDDKVKRITKFCVEDPTDTKLMYDYPMGHQSRLFVSESRDLIYIKSVNPLDFSYYPPGRVSSKVDKYGRHFSMENGETIHCYYWYWTDDEQGDDEFPQTRLEKIDAWLRGKEFD